MPHFRFVQQPSREQLHQITALYRQEGWWQAGDDNKLLADIIRGSHCFLVAEADGEIIAMGRAISDKASDAYIQDVAVKTGFQGQGIGSVLVERLLQRLRSDGLKWIGLIAEKGSSGFYERLGFRTIKNAVPLLNAFHEA